ncbi:uncharacterized protein B0H64DRAFT_123173 [Chaetomium fimeti]|uniref:Uncharacterized protein n=1 Tax=Chaetomium fimeti TaxID=1854472 RepID=A0AAE0HIT3_9PEZI|nr:hypothetical protein B0H64DRAFT_123173 [Chaetomium fimeti]
MQNSLFLSLLGLLAVSVANATFLDNTPDYALILSRQAPGTPQFECHSNCGNALAGGRDPAHCDNATWTGYYEACLGCALDFDIWRIYGNGVSSAASACGLSATPSPSGDDGPAPSSTPATGSSEASAPTTASADVSETPSETASDTGSPDGPAVTAPPSATDSETVGSTPSTTTSVSTAAAPRPVVSSLGSMSCVGVLVAVFAGLMGPL